MATVKTYNGWANRETWAISRWIGTKEPRYRHWRAVAANLWRDAQPSSTWSRSESARYALADRLEKEFEQGRNDLLDRAGAFCTVWADLLMSALSEVDWPEIADSLLEGADGYESAR